MSAGRHTIEVDEFVTHPVEHVWEALTDSEQLAAWFMANDFRPEVGHRFTLDTGRWGLTHCEVTEIEPPWRLSYTWRNGPLDTVVTWRLLPEGRGTRILLEHRGFDRDDPAQRAAFDGMNGGWRSAVIAALTAHLATSPNR